MIRDFTYKDVLERIRLFRVSSELSRFALSKLANLPESTLRVMDDPSWSPASRVVRKLEAVIPIDFMVNLNNAKRSPVKRKIKTS